MDNLGKMDKFLEKYIAILIQEEAESLNRLITPGNIEAVIKRLLGHKKSLNKFKNIEIISSIFLDHMGLKLEKKILEEKLKSIQI